MNQFPFPFPMTVHAPGEILTRTIPALDMAGLKVNDTLIVEIDSVDRDGVTYRRSGLVKTVKVNYVRGADPERTVILEFADPDIEDRTYTEADEVTIHLVTYSHLEKGAI